MADASARKAKKTVEKEKAADFEVDSKTTKVENATLVEENPKPTKLLPKTPYALKAKRAKKKKEKR